MHVNWFLTHGTGAASCVTGFTLAHKWGQRYTPLSDMFGLIVRPSPSIRHAILPTLPLLGLALGLNIASESSDKIPLTLEGTLALQSYLVDFLLTPELWTSTLDASSLFFSTTLPLGNVLYTFVTILSVDPWSDTY